MNPTARSLKPVARKITKHRSNPKPIQNEKDNIVPSSLLFSSLLFSSHLVMAQTGNCTDYSLCFEKRVDSNGDTIVDVLLINAPDSILGMNLGVRISNQAFNGSTFNLIEPLVELSYEAEYEDATNMSLEDEIDLFNVHFSTPLLLSADTVTLYSFTIEGPPGECIGYRFVDNVFIYVRENPFDVCYPDSTNLCTDTLCFPQRSIGGVVESFVNCEDTVANDFGMRDVNVEIYQNSSSQPYTVGKTTNQGDYETIVAPGNDYKVKPVIDTSKFVDTCGVTEIDVALIRAHLLGTVYLDDPYEYIAADADQNDIIQNIGDIGRIVANLAQVEGDTVICDTVGLMVSCDTINEFYLGWEFAEVQTYNLIPNPIVPAGTTFVPTVNNIWNFINLVNNESVSFYGIKIGDVNQTCTDCYIPGEGRSEGRSPINYTTNSETFHIQFPPFCRKGETIRVPVYDDQFLNESVFGLHLHINPDYLRLKGVEKHYLPENSILAYGTNSKGYVSVEWSDALEPVYEPRTNQPLFYLLLEIKAIPSHWQDVIKKWERSERNVIIDNDLLISDLDLKVDELQPLVNSSTLKEITVAPNPFHQLLTITLSSDIPTFGKLTLNNLRGIQVFEKQIELQVGINSILVDQLATLPAGVYFLTIELDDHSTEQIRVIKQ